MSLPSFELSVWVLAAFFTVYGIIFLVMSRNVGSSDDASFLKARLFLFLFSLLYFSFAHYAAYSAIVYSTEYGAKPPCTSLVNTSLVNTTTNLTSYTYMSSCSSTPPAAQVSFQVTYGWLLWIELFTLLIGSLYLIIDKGARSW